MVGPLALAASVDAVTVLGTGAIIEPSATDLTFDHTVDAIVAAGVAVADDDDTNDDGDKDNDDVAVAVAIAIGAVVTGTAMTAEEGSARCGPFGTGKSLVVPLAAGMEITWLRNEMRSELICCDW